MSSVQDTAALITNRAGAEAPRLAIVLGSGLGELADRVKEATRIPYEDLPGFPRSGVTGHAGALICGFLNGARVAVLAGRSHYYEHGDAGAMRHPIAVLAELGCPVLALSNAAGSTREDMPPGSLMAICDHLNWSGLNPLIGTEGDKRFVDLSDAYDPELRRRFERVAEAQGQVLHSGVYAWFSGPAFETPAEIRAIRMLGADAVGMSTVPEVILARYHGMRAAAVSVVTNFAAGMAGATTSHAHTKIEADKAKEGFIALFSGFAGTFAQS
ncbi:MAG: purine-nucleoside phosphorylase [Rhodobacteraceae bacterium]|nr:purine-nucleoside phosphorylase [Paracoccaceae bacterium]